MAAQAKKSFLSVISNKLGLFFENITLLDFIKFGVFVILIGLSLLYNVSMFYQLGSTDLEKDLFILASFAIEGAKIFFLINGSKLLSISRVYDEDSNELILNSKDKKIINLERRKILYRKIPSIREFILYFGFSVLSVMASYGYTLTTIDKNKIEIEANQTNANVNSHVNDIQQLTDEITRLSRDNDSSVKEKETIDKQVSTLIETGKIDYIPSAQSNRKNALDKSISDNNKIISTDSKLISDYRKEDAVASKGSQEVQVKAQVKTMFTLLGQAFGIPEEKFRFFITFLISILVEIGIISMKPSANIRKELEEHEKLIKAKKFKFNLEQKQKQKQSISSVELSIPKEDNNEIELLLEKAMDLSKELDEDKKKELDEVTNKF